jgi:hypothetical protein
MTRRSFALGAAAPLLLGAVLTTAATMLEAGVEDLAERDEGH